MWKIKGLERMLKTPLRRKLGKLLMKKVTLTKYAFSNGDDAYGQRERDSGTSYIFNAEIQEITSEDLAFFVQGTVHLGDAYGYFLPDYPVKGQTISIASEDEVTWNGKTWRIDTIEDYTFGEQVWYKKALMRRVI